jgi:DNA polymerase-3 subunit epsilon
MTDDTETAPAIEIVGYAITDTETSGLFDMKLPADHESQGRLAELAIIVTDLAFAPQFEFSFYVRPDGWSMQEGATAVNGLTDEFLHANGVPIGHVLDAYEAIIKGRNGVIAYGAQFDGKVMRGEFRRARRDDLFAITMNSCAMRSAMKFGIKNLDKPRGWPKLAHCCQHFGIEQAGEHGAMGDARALLEVAKRLHAEGALFPPSIHYAKEKV